MLEEEGRRTAGWRERYPSQAPDRAARGRPADRGRQHSFEVIWTPGHTSGHICLWDAERKAIMTGDHVLDPISPNVSLSRERQGNPLGEYLQSLRKVAELDADLVLPAHGEPFNGVARRVRELLAHHDEREQEVLDAVSHGTRTAYQVASALPWTRGGARWPISPWGSSGWRSLRRSPTWKSCARRAGAGERRNGTPDLLAGLRPLRSGGEPAEGRRPSQRLALLGPALRASLCGP